MYRMSSRLFSLAIVSLASAASLAFGLVACESATNLDVTYGDASAALEASTSADADAAQGDGGAPPTPSVVSGCPCDESAGVGCCIPAGGGAPFCTTDMTACADEKGAYLRCSQPDPLTESECCWRAVASASGGTATVAAFASGCDGGTPACLVASDCAGSGASTCTTAVCHGVTIGACGATAPVCPP
ncbi:MAG: hypothetical protein JWP87_2701 [Labilithrix sp.]|nr:hypothetical protein [Labilithrix sp.]